jgi:thiamine-monophosphate kinase
MPADRARARRRPRSRVQRRSSRDRRAGGERALIRRLTARLERAPGTRIGPGDDAAVVNARAVGELAITTDALVEDRHFRRAWMRVRGIGARLSAMLGTRLAAANLSDLAAMGARPRWAVLSAGVTRQGAVWLEATERSLARALERAGATLVGGNLCRVEGLEWLSLTLIGDLTGVRPLRRSGARAGDWIAVTGHPGRAAAFEALADAGRFDRALAAAWAAPPSRVAFAHAVAAARLANAAIDISDGAAGDLAQIARACGLSAMIDPASWPADETLARAWHASAGPRAATHVLRADALAKTLGPSDDYELILAVPPARRAACERLARRSRTPLAFVGRFTRGVPGALWLRASRGKPRKLEVSGFDHFAPGRARRPGMRQR